MADTKRTAQKASDRWKGDFMGEKEVSHLRRFQDEAQDDEISPVTMKTRYDLRNVLRRHF